METKKFIIEVEKGETRCSKCPFGDCPVSFPNSPINCKEYDLATMKIKKENNEYINHSIDNSILDNSEFDYGHNITHIIDGE